jgi:hypothetical protein
VLEDSEGIRLDYQSPTPGQRVRNLALAPFDLVAVPRTFHNYNNPGIHAHLGMLAVAFPFLLVFTRRVSVTARVLAGFAAAWFLIWSQSMQYARYLLPLTPILGLAGGEAVVKLGKASRILAILATGAVVLQAGITLRHFGGQLPERLAIATDPAARERFLTASVNVYSAQKWINRNTPQDNGVVLFEETRGFFLDRPTIWGNGPHSLYIPYHQFRSGQEMANWFVSQGFRYAILNLQFSPRIQTPEDQRRMMAASAEGTAALLILEWYADSARLAEIRDRDNDPEKPSSSPHRYRDEYWRLLVGDAVENGGAVIVPEASTRGAVVLEFRAPR